MQLLYFDLWPMGGTFAWQDEQRKKTNEALQAVNDWTEEERPDDGVVRLLWRLHREIQNCSPDSPRLRDDLVRASRYVRSNLPVDDYGSESNLP